MPTFNPSTVILTIDDEPMKGGNIIDPDIRANIKSIRVRLAAATENQQAAIQEELRLAIEDAQPVMTIGSTIITTLVNALPDPDDKTRSREETISGEEKDDLSEMAIRIKKAMKESVTAIVKFNQKEIDIIKKRVNRGYANPLIVGRIFAEIKPDPKEEEAK